MREVITVQIGQCGNAVGSQFWEILCLDHCLNLSGVYMGQLELQLRKISSFFFETRGMRYTPRSVLIDLDRSSLQTVRSSPVGRIFMEDNFMYGCGGTGNNWAKGHLSEGAGLCDKSLETIRREVEGCDCFHGFQVIHAIGGGTGGGLGSLIIGKIKDEYPGRITCTYSIIPSSRVSNSTVEPYNAVLSINHLIDNTQETIFMDNEALYFIATNLMRIKQVGYCDLNYVIGLSMSGITAPMRFSCTSSISLMKLAVNLVPFPRLHFLVPSYAPLASKASRVQRDFSVNDLVNQVFDRRRMFAVFDPKRGSFLTIACLLRGDISMKDVDNHIQSIKNRNSSSFVEWIPDNLKTTLCCYPLSVVGKSATCLINTTCIKNVFTRIRNQYVAMFKRKAFLHWFTGEGMEEIEFDTAESNLNELILDYKQNEDNRASLSSDRETSIHNTSATTTRSQSKTGTLDGSIGGKRKGKGKEKDKESE